MKSVFLLSAALIAVLLEKPVKLTAEDTFESKAILQLKKFTTGEKTGLAVLVARDGKIVLEEGFGFADLAEKTPVTAETKFRIGSISKQFTAAAILRLAEQGKLTLDDPLAKHFPEWSHHPAVTLKHLLTHTSGLHSYTEKPEFLGRATQPIAPAELMEWFRNDPPDFAPGKGFHYCNSGYFLLGEIVAKVSGKSLAEYLQETFFEPLQMHDTGIYKNDSPPPKMAKGYSLVDEKFTPALDWDMSWAGGAGALYSTVGDLFRWNEALYGGGVLEEASFRAAITPVELPADVDGMKYGYGLLQYEIQRLPAFGHGGGLNGWTSDLVRLPEQKTTIVVLTNASPGLPELLPQGISQTLARKLLADEIAALPPLQEDKSADPKTFGVYAGRYDYGAAILTVSADDDGLFAQLTGQDKFPVFPKSKDEFFWKVADAEVQFLRDESGAVIAARHTQGGNTFTAKKLGKEIAELTAEQLDSFAGQYQYGPGVVMTVTRDEMQLFAQLTNQPKLPIFPTSETDFEWRIVKAKVQFVKDEQGKVTKAIHHQGALNFEAPKIK